MKHQAESMNDYFQGLRKNEMQYKKQWLFVELWFLDRCCYDLLCGPMEVITRFDKQLETSHTTHTHTHTITHTHTHRHTQSHTHIHTPYITSCGTYPLKLLVERHMLIKKSNYLRGASVRLQCLSKETCLSREACLRKEHLSAYNAWRQAYAYQEQHLSESSIRPLTWLWFHSLCFGCLLLFIFIVHLRCWWSTMVLLFV